jgi:hypothetical protein
MKRALAQRSMGIAGHINRMATTLPALSLVPTAAVAPASLKNKLIKNIFRAYRNRIRPSSALVPSRDIKPEMLKKMAAGKLLGAALLRGNASRTMRNYRVFMLSRFGSTVHPDDRPRFAEEVPSTPWVKGKSLLKKNQ